MAQVFHRGEARILLYSRATKRKQTGSALAVCDYMQDLVSSDSGDNGEGAEAGITANWQSKATFNDVSPLLRFVRLNEINEAKEGAKEATDKKQSGRAGFILKARVVPQNIRIKPDPKKPSKTRDPELNKNFPVLEWEVTSGSAWETDRPADWKTLGLKHRVQPLDKAVGIRTVKPLSNNGAFEASIRFQGVCENWPDTALAHARLSFGERRWSFVFPHKAAPYLAKATGNIKSPWETWATFDSVGALDFQKDIDVRCENIDGKLYVQIANKRFCVANKNKTSQGKEEVISFDWSGRVEWAEIGVSAILGFSLLDYNVYDKKKKKDVPIQAAFSYSRPHTLRIGNVSARGNTGGNNRYCPDPVVLISGSGGSADVTCTLKAEDKYGRYTPFVAAVMGNISPTSTAVSVPPLDIREACDDLSLESAEPGLLASSQATITLNRNTLKELSADWQDYAKAFRYAEISVSRQLRDTETGAITQTEWVPVLDGYTWAPVNDTQSVNDLKGTLVIRDPMVRLQAPSGIIDDEKFGPLDAVYAALGRNLYGPDAVQYIIRAAVSSEMADDLNAGEPFAFLSDKIALIAFDGKTFGVAPFLKQPTVNSFLFPPPYDKDALSWITGEIAPLDRAFFCFGYHPAIPTDHMVPLYGRILNYIKAYGPTPLPLDDAIYDPNSRENALIARLQSRLRTEKAYNEFSVRSSPPSGGAGQVMASLFSGYDRTSAGSPYSIEDTWPRRLTLRNKLFDTFPEGIQAIASLIALEFEGVEPDDVSLDLSTGREDIRWGRIVMPRMSKPDAEDGDGDASDASLALNGQKLIVKRVSHKLHWGGNGANFTTNLLCRRANQFGF